MRKLKAAFHNFENAPNLCVLILSINLQALSLQFCLSSYDSSFYSFHVLKNGYISLMKSPC